VLAEATVWLFAGTIIVRSIGKVPSLLTLAKVLVAGGLMLGLFHVLKGADVPWWLNLCLGSIGYLTVVLSLRAIPEEIQVALLPKSAS
jgi:hypothetical protein